MTDAGDEDLDAIAAALGQLRGRGRGPFGPGGPFGLAGAAGTGGPFGPGGMFGPRGPGGAGGPGEQHRPGRGGRGDGTRGDGARGGTGRGDSGWGDHAGRGGRRGRSDEPGDEGGPRSGQESPWSGGHGGMRGAAPARLRLLEALAAASHPLSVSEVGEAIGVDQPRASRLIQQSVDLGLVRREADPDDARRTRVALTDEGTRLVRGFRGQRREQLSAALAGFTPDERAELARLLAKLAAAWPHAGA